VMGFWWIGHVLRVVESVGTFFLIRVHLRPSAVKIKKHWTSHWCAWREALVIRSFCNKII
jgi:uncharacterized membrane protein